MPVQAGRKVVRPRTRDGAAASVASVDGRAEKAMDEKEVLEEMARLMTKTARERCASMAGKRAPREIRTSALRNALIMQMLMGIDEMWSIRDRHLQKRLTKTEEALEHQNDVTKELRARLLAAENALEACQGELAQAKEEIVTLMAEKEEFAEAIVKAEQAAVAATVECHNLQEEVENVALQHNQWQKTRAMQEHRLNEELRRVRIELRDLRMRSKKARTDILHLQSRVHQLQEGPMVRDGDATSARGGSANHYLLEMSVDDRTRAVSRAPASTVFEFRPTDRKRRPRVKGRGEGEALTSQPEEDSHTVRSVDRSLPLPGQRPSSTGDRPGPVTPSRKPAKAK